MEPSYRMRKMPEHSFRAEEVVRVVNERPHLFVRVEVRGEYFPHRAPHAFVMVEVGAKEYLKDAFTEVSPDNQALIGYLPVDLPPDGTVVFGYGDEIWGSVPEPFRADDVGRLDRDRIPEETVVVDQDFVNIERHRDHREP